MASKKEVKEQIRNYILENYSRFSEAEGDEEDDDVDIEEPTVDVEDSEEDPKDSEQAFQGIVDLLNSTGQRATAILRRTDSKEEKMDILNRMVDFTLNGFTTREDLPNSTLRDFFIKKFSTDGGASMEEMSTTAGAPAPATKYAFKRKKK